MCVLVGATMEVNVAGLLIKTKISQHWNVMLRSWTDSWRDGGATELFFFFYGRRSWSEWSCKKTMLRTAREINWGRAGNRSPCPCSRSPLHSPPEHSHSSLGPCAVVSARPLGQHIAPWFMEFRAPGARLSPIPINCSLSQADLAPVLYFLDHKVVLCVT